MPSRRRLIQGVRISGGIVLGKARVITPGVPLVTSKRIPASKVASEIDRLETAVEDTVRELRAMRDAAGKKIGGPIAKIFDAQLLIAQDQEFLRQVKEEIASGKRDAAYVYDSLVKQTTEPLSRSAEEYMRQMVIDVQAVAHRILLNLNGYAKESEQQFPAGTVLVGRSFSPNDVLVYRQRRAQGFVVAEGGNSSHMALIARSFLMPIVMVKADDLGEIAEGERLILDGSAGEVLINPTDKDWTAYQKKRRREGSAIITRIKRLPHIPPRTRDGIPVGVAANLTLPGTVEDILAEMNIPVGLYRSEFLYLKHNDFPDEQTQYEHYAQIAERFSHTTVAVRTFDIGYDKVIDTSGWPAEGNPALGWRGVRATLDMPEVFRAQIRAILRASYLHNLKIILPMVAELSEIERAKKIVAQEKFSLRKKGVPFDEKMPIGIMVEIPAAAMTADQMAQKVDFMSIGTNDLTQYTLAADRMNNKVSALYNALHPAVLRLVKMTVDAAHRHLKPVSVCGELGGDILALPLFIAMRIDQLSISPNRIFDVCRAVSRIDSELTRPLLESVLSSGSLQSVVSKLERYRKAMENR
jgi:phosphotransferase system enzyme I (PtsI)